MEKKLKLSFNIGINQYSPNVYGAESNLKQCVRDTNVMADIAKRNGFDCKILIDSDATISNYVKYLDEISKVLKPNDVLLITQSSHGTYFDDPYKGRATGLCFYDDVFWDVEQVDVWKKFAKGVKIIRVIDCCFSESNFRRPIAGEQSLGTARSVKVIGAVPPKPTNGNLRGVNATIISLASSSVKEVSYENTKGGVFTQALEEMLKQDPNTTYKNMLIGTQNLLVSWGYPQTPKLEYAKAGKFQNNVFLT